MGCRTAQWHLDKAVDKGAKFYTEIVTVSVHDTVQGKHGKDSIITRNINIPCPDIEVPKVKWEVRFDNKRFKDSLKHIRLIYNDSLDNAFKTLRNTNKLLSDSLVQARKVSKYEQRAVKAVSRHKNRSLWWLWMLFGGIIAFALVYIYVRLKRATSLLI